MLMDSQKQYLYIYIKTTLINSLTVKVNNCISNINTIHSNTDSRNNSIHNIIQQNIIIIILSLFVKKKPAHLYLYI